MWIPTEASEFDDLIDWVQESGRLTEPELAVESVVCPSTFRDGLLDRRAVTGGDIVRCVSFGYSIERSSGEDQCARYVCVLRPANHRLIAGLEVFSGSGRRLQGPSPQTTTRVVARAMWARIQGLVTHPEERIGLARRLLELIRDSTGLSVRAQRDAIDKVEKTATDRAREILNGVDGLQDAPGPKELLQQLVGVVAARQPLLVLVPPGEDGLLSYTMREAVGESLGMNGRVRHRFANAIGAVPGELRIPLYKGGQSSGYVLDVDVGDGNYIRSIASEGASNVATTGEGTQFGTMQLLETLKTRDTAVVGIAEHPSKTMFSALLLGVATLIAVLLAWLARDKVAVWKGKNLGLGDLATALGLVALGGGAIRSVIYRGLQGRVLPLYALMSATYSATILITLGVALAWPSHATRTNLLTVLLAASAFGGLGIVLSFIRAVATITRLRRVSTSQHPERPLGA